MKIILASGSPRRQELLKLLIPDFSVIPADVDESVLANEEPDKYVARLALQKAEKIADSYPDSLIIGSDTTVVLNQEILGKPSDSEDALKILKKLSGQTHHVLTGIALVCKNKNICIAECSDSLVTFSSVSEKELRIYAESGEPLDKAGAYAIQGGGAVFVESITGSPSGIVGLDLNLLAKMLKSIKVL